MPSETPARLGFFHWPCFGERGYHGFPSGHAATAFAVAAALAGWAPSRHRWWIVASASGVGVSRIVLNAHFLSDVLGGALMGWWAGELGVYLVTRYLAASMARAHAGTGASASGGRVSPTCLVVHPGALGDVLLAGPALAHLRSLGYRTTLATTGRLVALFEGSGLVDATVDLEGLALHGLFEEPPSAGALRALAGYDAVVSWFGAGDPTFRASLAALGCPVVVARAAPAPAIRRHVSCHLVETLAPLGSVPAEDSLGATRCGGHGPDGSQRVAGGPGTWGGRGGRPPARRGQLGQGVAGLRGPGPAAQGRGAPRGCARRTGGRSRRGGAPRSRAPWPRTPWRGTGPSPSSRLSCRSSARP